MGSLEESITLQVGGYRVCRYLFEVTHTHRSAVAATKSLHLPCIQQPSKSLSDNPCGPISNPCAGEMQHAQIVLHILLPPYQRLTPKPVQPRVSALHHPAPSTVSGYVHTRTLLFPTTADVGGVTPLSHQLPDPWVVITFVQTYVLRTPLRRRGPVCHHRLQGRFHQLAVVSICPVHSHTYGNASALSWLRQHRPLHTQLAAISGIAPSGLTPRAGPSSWPHPSLASSILCP